MLQSEQKNETLSQVLKEKNEITDHIIKRGSAAVSMKHSDIKSDDASDIVLNDGQNNMSFNGSIPGLNLDKISKETVSA